MDEHGVGPFAYDLARLGFDIRGLFTGDISPAFVLALLENVEEGSATTAAIHGGDQHRGWDLNAYLMAGMFDALQAANYQRSGGKGKKPQPVPRPEEKKKARTVSVAEIAKRQKQEEVM